MGVTKNLIPKQTRVKMVEAFMDRFPEGFIHDHAANIITFTGLAAVGVGAAVGGKLGVAIRAAGELADDVDGDTARALSITSEQGEKNDAVSDKFKMLFELARLAWDSRKLSDGERPVRQAVLGEIAVKHTIVAGLNLYAHETGLKPSRNTAGQVNLWVDGITAAAFGVSDVTEDPVISRAIATIGYFGGAVGVVTGGLAINGYVNSYLRHPGITGPQQEPQTPQPEIGLSTV